MTLSAIIIAKNEEKRIKYCLKSVAFADEVITVIDRSSTDNTALLAQEAGAMVLFEDWQGYGHQKNKGAAAASGDWLLFVDADEEVTQDLAAEIHAIIQHPQYNVYWLKIITIFLGTSLRHLYGHNPRLFRRGAARWTDSYVHEQVVTVEGQLVQLQDHLSGILTVPLLHNSYSTVTAYLQKMHRYTSLDAEQMYRMHTHRSGRPVQPSILLPVTLALRQWVKLVFYRQGFLDGWAGFMWSTLSAYYEFEMARKFLALARNK